MCDPEVAQEVTPRGVRLGRCRLGGQACHAVWRPGFPGCCGPGRCQCCWYPCGGVCGVAKGRPCGSGLGVMSHRRLPSLRIARRVFCRRLRTYGWSCGTGELAGVDFLEMERINQHGFLCVLRDPSPRRPESTVFRCVPAGPADQSLEGGLRPVPLPQLRQLHVGPALPPRSTGRPVAFGVGVGVRRGAPSRVMGTGGGSGPGGVLIVLRREGCAGNGRSAGIRGHVDMWIQTLPRR